MPKSGFAAVVAAPVVLPKIPVPVVLVAGCVVPNPVLAPNGEPNPAGLAGCAAVEKIELVVGCVPKLNVLADVVVAGVPKPPNAGLA